MENAEMISLVSYVQNADITRRIMQAVFKSWPSLAVSTLYSLPHYPHRNWLILKLPLFDCDVKPFSWYQT